MNRTLALTCFAALSMVFAQQAHPGKAVFESRCAECHGADGNGGEFAAGIVTRIANRSDAEIASTINDGLPTRGMPAFNLDQPVREHLIAYLRTLHPPK